MAFGRLETSTITEESLGDWALVVWFRGIEPFCANGFGGFKQSRRLDGWWSSKAFMGPMLTGGMRPRSLERHIRQRRGSSMIIERNFKGE
ncbi:hypothetical protein Scep_007426 [Stephania cephalantha]|uniref:Uncharacterized protein n=1 Tax=Stephania cephalantha TaxID=152367 RepID=A0AAP0KBT5_9MAGN